MVRVTLTCEGLPAWRPSEVENAAGGTSCGPVPWEEEARSGGILNLREEGLAQSGRVPSGIQGESP